MKADASIGDVGQHLRMVQRGIARVAPSASFTFADAPLTGREGETIATALTAAEVRRLGVGADGKGRGLFCGMGVCQECLVSVDGISGQRACMTELIPGMRVEPQSYTAAVGAIERVGKATLSPSDHRPDILVIGGGPGGLSAARAAALCGAGVILVDERASPGGQYFKQLAKTHRFVDPAGADRQFREGRSLIDRVAALGIERWQNATVWGAFAPLQLAVSVAERQHVFRPQRLIVATGAYERGVPHPGWILPGYMTTGAAQALSRSYRVAPGRRVLISGNGPLNLQLAAELTAAGVQVVAVVEAAPPPSLARLGALGRALRSSPHLVCEGLRYLCRIRAAGRPVLFGSAIVAAEGPDRVERAVVARIDRAGYPIPGSERGFAVDAVCAGYGLLPANDVARALDCRHRFDPRKGSQVVECDADGLTTTPNVYVVGDSGGVSGAQAACEQGFIAGIAAARSLGHEPGVKLGAELAERRARLVRHHSFQAALWQIFEAPILLNQLADAATEICRCEAVTLAMIQGAIDVGSKSLGEIKRRTRAGMGRCQGRYCGPVIAALAAAHGVAAVDEFSFLSHRPPIKPILIRALAEEP